MRRRQQQPLGTEFCVVRVAVGVIYLFCCTIYRQVCVALTFPQNHNNSIYNELRWLIRLMHASVWHLRPANLHAPFNLPLAAALSFLDPRSPVALVRLLFVRQHTMEKCVINCQFHARV